MRRIAFSRRAERDLRRIGPGEVANRIRAALQQLATGEPTLDVKPLTGAAPWHRLRVGNYRVLYRPVAPDEAVDPDTAWLVARIIHRRDLERAVTTLT